jgi:hypothetical protein
VLYVPLLQLSSAGHQDLTMLRTSYYARGAHRAVWCSASTSRSSSANSTACASLDAEEEELRDSRTRLS